MATADITVIALGRPDAYVAEIQRRLVRQDRVRFRMHAMGTSLEGTTEDISRWPPSCTRQPRADRSARLPRAARVHYAGTELRFGPEAAGTTLNASYIQRLSEGYVAEPQSVPAARHDAESVKGVLGSRIGEKVSLLVSELVTNAVLHRSRRAKNAIRMRVWTSPTSIRVAVSNQGPAFSRPTHPAPGELAVGGWGLFMVERLADRWGVRRRAVTEVWFEIDT